MDSHFTTDLVMRDENAQSKHGLRFVLVAPLVYCSAYPLRWITVEEGFVTDLASIPRALYVALPPIGAYDEAAVVHDWLYQKAPDGVTRADADRIFREAMAVLGVGRLKRWTIYAGVRAGGWVPWKTYRSEREALPV